jgi:hypothetical protein
MSIPNIIQIRQVVLEFIIRTDRHGQPYMPSFLALSARTHNNIYEFSPYLKENTFTIININWLIQ